jgi:integrase/recombinase XerD
MRGFYNWAVELDLIKDRPDQKIKREKFESPQITPFSRDEIVKLIDGCQFTPVEKQDGRKYKMKRPNAERDKAIILLLLDTGMRLGELTRLRLGDVNLETGEVYVRPFQSGRKAKPRTLFMGTRTRQTVWKYIAKVQASTVDQSLQIFELKGPSIRLLVRRIGENVGVHNTHPHRFRHTFAITFLRNGGDVFTLQKLLGHATLDMTKRYLDLIKVDLENAHRKSSPVDNWRL